MVSNSAAPEVITGLSVSLESTEAKIDLCDLNAEAVGWI